MAEYQDDRARFGSVPDRLGEAGSSPGDYGTYAAAAGADAGAHSGQSGHSDLRDAASGLADRAKQQGKAMAAEKKDVAAEQVDSAAQALHKTAEELQGSEHPQAGRYVGYAAEQLEVLGRRLRDTDIDGLISQAETMGRRSPMAFFAGAVAVGFLASRFLKSSSSHLHGEHSGSGYRHGVQRHGERRDSMRDAGWPERTSPAGLHTDLLDPGVEPGGVGAMPPSETTPFPTRDSAVAQRYGDSHEQ